MGSISRSLAVSHVALCGAIGLAMTCLSAVAAPAEIATDSLLQHIKFLSSDELKGRGNGSAELEAAGDVHLAAVQGRRPAARRHQRRVVPTVSAGRRFEGRLGQRLSVGRQGANGELHSGLELLPALGTSERRSRQAVERPAGLPLVFAGYGLAVPDIGYDDYSRVDVNGKAVLIFSHEPQERDANSRLNGVRPVPQTSLAAKAALARSKGARMLLVVSDPSHKVDDAQYGLFAHDPDAENEGIPVLRIRPTGGTTLT